jgi:hypothetical protein
MMSKSRVKSVVPHPETGEGISLAASTVENRSPEEEFSDLFDTY